MQCRKETLRRPGVETRSAALQAGMLTVTQTTLVYSSQKFRYIFSHIKLNLINELVFEKTVLISSVIHYNFKNMYMNFSG